MALQVTVRGFSQGLHPTPYQIYCQSSLGSLVKAIYARMCPHLRPLLNQTRGEPQINCGAEIETSQVRAVQLRAAARDKSPYQQNEHCAHDATDEAGP